MRLGVLEQALIREAEEARIRAMQMIDRGELGSEIICAQDLRAAGESYVEAAKLIAKRTRKAQAEAGTP